MHAMGAAYYFNLLPSHVRQKKNLEFHACYKKSRSPPLEKITNVNNQTRNFALGGDNNFQI